MDIYIDGVRLDCDARTRTGIAFRIRTIGEPDRFSEYVSTPITVPATPANRRALGYGEQLLNPERFNRRRHTGYIEVDGVRIIEGEVQLAVSDTDLLGNSRYTVVIRGDNHPWVTVASGTMLHDTPLGISYKMSYENLADNLSVVDAAYRAGEPATLAFLPVYRGFRRLTPNGGMVRRDHLTFDDFFPFFNVRNLLRAIFGAAGYTVESAFFGTQMFKSLYISGNYVHKDTALLDLKGGFCAGSFVDRTGVADADGKVTVASLAGAGSPGNLADSADPSAVTNGMSLPDLYNNGGGFGLVDGVASYTPPVGAVMAFEYQVEYVSQSQAGSDGHTRWFDTVTSGGVSQEVVYKPDPFDDYSGRIAGGKSYLVTVVVTGGAAQGDGTLFVAFETAAGPVRHATAAIQSQTLTAPSDATGRVRIHKKSGSAYTDITADQFIRAKDLAPDIRVRVTIRTPYEYRRAGTAVQLNDLVFSGAKPGTKITVLASGTRVRSLYSASPGMGSTLSTSGMLNLYDVRQIDFIRAVAHLFNLRFHTDNREKKVFIEPAPQLFTGAVVDWSDRIDGNRPVEIEELGAEAGRTYTLCYRDTDDTVADYNEGNTLKYGRYRANLTNRFAKDRDENRINPLFGPSMVVSGVLDSALSASFLSVGKREAFVSGDDNACLTFEPKIVGYFGLRQLPEGERIALDSQPVLNSCPHVAFFDRDVPLDSDGSAENAAPSVFDHTFDHTFRGAAGGGLPGFSLLFGDWRGVMGLHKYHDEEIRALNAGRRIAAWLRLTPADVEGFVSPNDLCRDFRALYRLRVAGEIILCRLESIAAYDPNTPATRCTFVSVP